jgi:hypothetical protein
MGGMTDKPGELPPQELKAFGATAVLYGDRVEIRRRGLARFAAQTKLTVIPLADVVQVQWRDPSMVTNGCVFLATNEDVKTVRLATLTSERNMGGNPHVVVFSLRQRRAFAEFRQVLAEALPEVPTAPVG